MDTWVVSTFRLWVLLLIQHLNLDETVRMYPNFYFVFGSCMFLNSPCQPWVRSNRFIQKTVRQILDKWKIEPLYDAATAGLGIYPKEMKTGPWREICTSVYVAAFFTVAKIWKQPGPSMDKWVQKMWCVHIEWYVTQLWERRIQPFVTIRMGLEVIMLNEVSQTDKVYVLSLILCVISKRKNNQTLRNRQYKRGCLGVGE